MPQQIECVGHPRDMGESQGRACREAIREVVGAAGLPDRRTRLPSLLAYASGPVRGRGGGREIIRHYTHLSERIDGLARGAGVPADSILALHLATTMGTIDATGLERAEALLAGAAEHRTLDRSLPYVAGRGAGWILRRSGPEVGFASIEVTLPWLVSSLAGVNEAGLATCFLPSDAGPSNASLGPPPLLLVQECLQRFESIEAGVDWCRSRPSSGGGELLLADRSGAAAHVLLEGTRVGVERLDEGVLALGDDPTRKRLEEACSGGAAPALRALLECSGGTVPAAAVRLRVAEGKLELCSGGERTETCSLLA